MYKRAIFILGIVLIAGGALWAMQKPGEAPPRSGGVACTMEAKICPDGSAVGRTGPNCEFAPCPTIATTTATTTTDGGSATPPDSGVRGTISLGPTCPVERIPPDPQCADRPYATTIAVYRAGSKTPFMIGSSDSTGEFHFALPPGSYKLTAGSGATLPRCSPASIKVSPHAYVTTSISCDTGIR